MSDRVKKRILKYAVTAIISISVIVLILSLRDFSSITDQRLRFRYLADAFTIPGVILVMIAATVWISATGIFDGLSYALGRFIRSLVPFNKSSDETFYDYRSRKNENRFGGYSFLFIFGALMLAVAAVFIIAFYSL